MYLIIYYSYFKGKMSNHFHGRQLICLSHMHYNSTHLCSWPMVSPAPCSTSLLKFAISIFSCWIVSLALVSFSYAASRVFHAFSISFFKDCIWFWSSWDNFRAVATLAELAVISAFNSLVFCIKRFSLSWLFLRALWSFSYSWRNLSRVLSPLSCSSTFIEQK